MGLFAGKYQIFGSPHGMLHGLKRDGIILLSLSVRFFSSHYGETR